MRPEHDAEYGYPHPPPQTFRERPMTAREAVWEFIVPGALVGVFLGGCAGLLGGLVAWSLSDRNAWHEALLIVLGLVLAGAAAGAVVLGLTLAVLLGFLAALERLLDCVTRPLWRKLDPDAEARDEI